MDGTNAKINSITVSSTVKININGVNHDITLNEARQLFYQLELVLKPIKSTKDYPWPSDAPYIPYTPISPIITDPFKYPSSPIWCKTTY
jgi:hypothetical protein